MKTILKQIVLCGTIAGLFVLASVAQSNLGLLGSENARVALLTAAVLPPALTEMANADGPVLPPDPVDIPALRATLGDGPVLPPDPIDIPALRVSIADGPVLPPDPIDIPARTDGPVLPPDPVDIPALRGALGDGPVLPPDPIDIPSRA
jgi:hypothetical protein